MPKAVSERLVGWKGVWLLQLKEMIGKENTGCGSCKLCKHSMCHVLFLQPISALQFLLFADSFALIKMHLALATFKSLLRA